MTTVTREHHKELQQIARKLGFSLRKQSRRKLSQKPVTFRLVNKDTRKTVHRGSIYNIALALLDYAIEAKTTVSETNS